MEKASKHLIDTLLCLERLFCFLPLKYSERRKWILEVSLKREKKNALCVLELCLNAVCQPEGLKDHLIMAHILSVPREQ